jgi:thiamine biosynthesis lipoprotein ApbE
VFARLSVRQTALGASGLRKGDHIVDPRTGKPARGRGAAWVAVPRPEGAGAEARTDAGPRIAATAVADALTTAFMLLSPGEVEALCERSPGLEAWILMDPADGPQAEATLLHFSGSGQASPPAAGRPQSE